MKNILSSIKSFRVRKIRQNILASKRYKKSVTFVQKRPFLAFFASLGLLLLILIAGSVVSNLGKKEVKAVENVKTVQTLAIGQTPSVKLQAQIEKKGIIQIVAQTPGVVDTIHTEEGQTLQAGQKIVSLSTNYQGGNAASLQRQLAGAQAKNAYDTYDTQKELLKKQREVAEKSSANSEELRKISRDSAGDTAGLLRLNEEILQTVDEQLEQAEQSGTPADIAAAKSQKAQVESGITQLRGTLRGLEYQGNEDKPAADLAGLQKDIALKQLDVQEKALDLGRQVAGIQYNLALVQEGMMNPSAPYEAVVERIFVEKGEVVNPGTPIAIVRCLDIETSAVIRVPRTIALTISRTEPTIFLFGNKKVSALPSYVSAVATDGQLHTIVYTLPEGVTNTTDKEYVSVEVPVVSASESAIPYIPIDSVYQSQDETTVNIVDGDKVSSRKIELGGVYGSFVEVVSGLNRGDKVILNRNVVTGDKIKTE